MNVVTKSIQLQDGRTITIETGKLAKQADGSVMLRLGNTVLLATVCAAKDAVPGTDFMPLQVDYREQYSAAGRFPGGFTKREGKPSDNEILTSRLVDRVLRPLFPSNYHAEVYVTIMLLSADGVDQPDALAGFAASAALACSDIPFECPISEVRVARVNGEYVINPTFEQMKEADMDIMVGASAENIMMVEGEMKEVSEQDMIGALKAAMDAIKPMCELQKELSKELGKDVKREYDHEVNDEELREQMNHELYRPVYDVTKQALEKQARQEAFDKILEDFKEKYVEAHADLSEDELDEKNGMMDRYYHDVMRDAMRRCILDEGIRLDGRRTDEIRPIWCEVSPLPMPHGSSVFTRGETQTLATCTLGTKLDEKLVDDVLDKSYMRFLLHYNFPPFCTGEAKAQRGVGRREIGHGHLAWRGLKDMIPADFPYTVRLVSQVLESNGSSSMATVCSGTLALMDAGVPMKKPVSGIAMGLIKNPGEEKYAVLSDILGDEDHLGDMDFKTTGTKDGLTATQMDIKCDGLSFEILEKALMQAKAGREHILGKLVATIAEPRAELKPHVPRIEQFDIPKEFIGAVIGPGGKSSSKSKRRRPQPSPLTRWTAKAWCKSQRQTARASRQPLPKSKPSSVCPKLEKSTKAWYAASCHTAASWRSCQGRMGCCTSLRLTGNVWNLSKTQGSKRATRSVSSCWKSTPRPGSTNSRIRYSCPSPMAMWSVSAAHAPSAVRGRSAQATTASQSVSAMRTMASSMRIASQRTSTTRWTAWNFKGEKNHPKHPASHRRCRMFFWGYGRLVAKRRFVQDISHDSLSPLAKPPDADYTSARC